MLATEPTEAMPAEAAVASVDAGGALVTFAVMSPATLELTASEAKDSTL